MVNAKESDSFLAKIVACHGTIASRAPALGTPVLVAHLGLHPRQFIPKVKELVKRIGNIKFKVSVESEMKYFCGYHPKG